jgi:hypothetical protein
VKKPSQRGTRLNLKRIQAESPNVERLRGALRGGRDAWGAPFAASGAKPPNPGAPIRRGA